MSEFELQVRSISNGIWGVPNHDALWGRYTLHSPRASVLRHTIDTIADEQGLDFALHWRIVTTDGAPVERWKTKPGRATRARRRY